MAEAENGRRVEVYRREDGTWEWRRVADRGNLPDAVVATSGGQGYENRAEAVDAAARENPGLVVEVEPDR